MQKITPHLWFDKEAVQAAEFYVSVFGNGSQIKSKSRIYDTPSGDCDIVSFDILGYSFMAISAGPLFKFNPSISFHIKCKTKEEVDVLWKRLADGGGVLMPLDKYPFSARYGWLVDKYGLSWQIIFVDGQELSERIVPALLFVGKICGKTEEAINFYASVFHNSSANILARYGKGAEPDKEGAIQYADVMLEGQRFGAMDSAHEHGFAFNEAISFMVNCVTQEEIDYYWEKLSAVPEAEQCGWLKDKYGVSWQIVPTILGEMMAGGDEKKTARVTQTFLKMKKFDISKLKEAAEE